MQSNNPNTNLTFTEKNSNKISRPGINLRIKLRMQPTKLSKMKFKSRRRRIKRPSTTINILTRLTDDLLVKKKGIGKIKNRKLIG